MPNILRAALFLGLTLFGIAGLYVLMNAPFLAAVQVMIYVGAITTMIILAIFLSHRVMKIGFFAGDLQPDAGGGRGGADVSVPVPYGGEFGLDQGHRCAGPATFGPGRVAAVAEALLQPYVFPFELASLVLLAVLVGAVVIAKEDTGGCHSAYGIPISWFLTVGAMLFCIGLFGMMIRRSAIGMLLSIELMLNAANINLVAFGSYLKMPVIAGQIFAIFVITLAAAEAAIGLAIVINIYRTSSTSTRIRSA